MRLSVLLALVCSLACGSNTPANFCTKNSDCPVGQGCLNSACEPLPCGGCQPDEACSAGKCVAAQNAGCTGATDSCPLPYTCNGQICTKPCTVNTDCDSGF